MMTSLVGSVIGAKLNAAKIVKHDSPDRERMTHLVNRMSEFPAVDCPVKHRFLQGMYVRECIVPPQTLFVTKIHKTQHILTITEGDLEMVVDGVKRRIKAPFTCITEPGTQRAIYAHTKVVGLTYHPNPDNETDLEVLESRLIAEADEPVDPQANRIDVIEFTTGDIKLLEDLPCHG